jgi:hypothetical protein
VAFKYYSSKLRPAIPGEKPVPNSPNMLEINSKLADEINAQALADPQSPYAGKFVGLANGQVVVVAKDLDEVCDALERIEPDPARTFIVEAGVDNSKVEYIWESHGCHAPCGR